MTGTAKAHSLPRTLQGWDVTRDEGCLRCHGHSCPGITSKPSESTTASESQRQNNARFKLLTPSHKLSCSVVQWRTPQQAQTRTTPSKRTCALHQPSSSKDKPNCSSWISWFLSSKGNEYFCEVEDDYILDRFNLTGLNTEVQNYTQALDLITDNLGARDPLSCTSTTR